MARVSFLFRDWTGRVSVRRQKRKRGASEEMPPSSQDLFYNQIFFSKVEASLLLVLVMTSNINKNSHYSQI